MAESDVDSAGSTTPRDSELEGTPTLTPRVVESTRQKKWTKSRLRTWDCQGGFPARNPITRRDLPETSDRGPARFGPLKSDPAPRGIGSSVRARSRGDYRLPLDGTTDRLAETGMRSRRTSS